MAQKGKAGSNDEDLFPPVRGTITRLRMGPMNFGRCVSGDRDMPVVLSDRAGSPADLAKGIDALLAKYS